VKGTFIRVLAALAIVTTFGLAPAAAQTGQTFGEVVGKITDDQGAVLPGVTVSLSGPAVMGTPTAVSGSTGVADVPLELTESRYAGERYHLDVAFGVGAAENVGGSG